MWSISRADHTMTTHVFERNKAGYTKRTELDAYLKLNDGGNFPVILSVFVRRADCKGLGQLGSLRSRSILW